jgi:hypothetical protein
MAPKIIEDSAALIESAVRLDQAFKSMFTNSNNFFGNIKDGTQSIASLATIIDNSLGIKVSEQLSGMVSLINKIGPALDSLGKTYRDITSENLDFASAIGQSTEQAIKFNDRLGDIEKINAKLSVGGFFINQEETSSSFKQLTQSLKDSSDEFLSYSGNINGVKVSAEQMVAALQGVSGLRDYAYYGNLETLISKQGLSFDQAIKTMVSYKDISSETGLSVQTVSETLSSSVSQFSKLGLTVDFAKPALEGFASTMKKVGLGISEASDLTRTLSNSLINAANDYGKAYVMFQQGGLDFGGGGGAIGASIGFRAKMMDATPEEQEKMGLDLVQSMRDTLSNLTGGGGIIGIKEAAESPELQSKYLMQEQLLSSMFGISDQGQRDRTLEMLSEIENQTEIGNKDRALQLAEELKNAEKAREETKSSSEKLGAIAMGSFYEHIKHSAFLQKQLEISILSAEGGDKKSIAQEVQEFSNKTTSAATNAIKELTEELQRKELKPEQIIAKLKLPEDIENTEKNERNNQIYNAVGEVSPANASVNSGSGSTVNITINASGSNDFNQSRYTVIDNKTNKAVFIPQNKADAFEPLLSGIANRTPSS